MRLTLQTLPIKFLKQASIHLTQNSESLLKNRTIINKPHNGKTSYKIQEVNNLSENTTQIKNLYSQNSDNTLISDSITCNPTGYLTPRNSTYISPYHQNILIKLMHLKSKI